MTLDYIEKFKFQGLTKTIADISKAAFYRMKKIEIKGITYWKALEKKVLNLKILERIKYQ